MNCSSIAGSSSRSDASESYPLPGSWRRFRATGCLGVLSLSIGVRRGVCTAGDGAGADPDGCEKEEDFSFSVGLVLSLIFGVVVFGLDVFFSAAAAAARVEAEVLSLSLTIELVEGGRRCDVVVDIEMSHQPQLSLGSAVTRS